METIIERPLDWEQELENILLEARARELFELLGITDANGFWQRASDGVFVDPATLQPGDTTVWAKETVDRPNLEIIQQVRDNITNYLRWAVANRVTGDHTGDDTKPLMFNGVAQRKGRQAFRRAVLDRYGLLNRPAIQGLQGQAEAVS